MPLTATPSEANIAVVPWLLLLPVGLLFITVIRSFAGFVVLAADRGEPAVMDRRVISLYIREGVARAVMVVLRPLGFTDTGPHPAGEPGEARSNPVLLVPSGSNNRSSLGFLRTFLVRRGFRWVWAVNTSLKKAGIAAAAEEVGLAVERLKREAGVEQIDLIGAGTGGLAAAWFVRHLDTEGSVRRLVTVGTPWRGTKMSVFSRGQLATESTYGNHILDDLVPPPVRTISIWSPDDPIVIPADSATPESVESVEVSSAGHSEMLVSARVFRAVQAALS